MSQAYKRYKCHIANKRESSRYDEAFGRSGFSSSLQQSPDRDNVADLYYANGSDQHVIGRKHANVRDQQEPAHAELRNVEQPADRHSGQDASATLIHECKFIQTEKSPPSRRAQIFAHLLKASDALLRQLLSQQSAAHRG